MPELPEVETVRRGLDRLIVGKVVRAVTHDTPKSFPNVAADAEQFLIGATIRSVRRRAKVLLIELDTDYTLVVHLKMTGQLVFVGHTLAVSSSSPRHPRHADTSEQSLQSAELGQSPQTSSIGQDHSLASTGRMTKSTQAETASVEREVHWGGGHPNDSLIGLLPDRSTRVEMTFDDDSKLFFNDQRKFGWMKLFPTLEVPNIDFMQKVGPEPLEDDFTAAEFIPRVRRRAGTTIKAAILDQTVLAGVGNIYADESLWAARIHPSTRVRDMSDKQLAQLLVEIKFVMNLSIEKGGSSNHTYRDAEGNKGSYMQFANVFRRDGLTCPRHPDVSIEKIRVAGRGTHICPACQPLIDKKA